MIKLKFLIASTLILILYSCQYTDNAFQYNVGDGFVTDPVKVIMIDTLSVYTYTTAIDSIPTSQNTRFMAGRFENSYGVVTTCESYFRIDPVQIQPSNSSSVFDSASMILYLDRYSFGDTVKICKFELYRLSEAITVDEKSWYIFNTTQFSHETKPLATFTVDLTNQKRDSIAIKLPYEFGKELYDLAINTDPVLHNADLFKSIYRGFLIKPSDDNISVVGFVADPVSAFSPKIKIFYHDNSIIDDMSFNFNIEIPNSSSLNELIKPSNFYASNYFKNDYSKLIGYGLPTGKGKLPSSETKNSTFLQGGLNLRTRIEIPGIDKLHYLGIGSVIKAELYFEPVIGSYKYQSDLPSMLEMYLINIRNEIEKEKYPPSGQLSQAGSSDIAYGVLHYNKEFKNETYYSFDITKYIVDEYADPADHLYSLLLALPQKGIYENVDQLIIGDQNHPTNKMKLKVYIAIY